MATSSNSGKISSWLVLIVLVAVVLTIYKDFGIGWDEPQQRFIGTKAYNYIAEGNEEYLTIEDRIYGVAFEIPLVFLEKKLGLKNDREVFLFRHLVYALFFCIGCFVFYRLVLRLFQSNLIALVSLLSLILCPRILGHAFINSKDVPFMVMFIITGWYMFAYMSKPSYLKAIALAFCSGLLINFRILGVLGWVVAGLMVLLYAFKEDHVHRIVQFFIYLVVSVFSLVISWPFLWKAPYENFMYSFHEMSKYPWNEKVLFGGKQIYPSEHLFEYLFSWFAMSIPILILLLGLFGMGVFVFNLIAKRELISANRSTLFLMASGAFVILPIAAVLKLKSTLYDDWRQLYFIYPWFVLFIAYLLSWIQSKSYRFYLPVVIVCFAYFGFLIVKVQKLHPYEYVYFNELVSKRKNHLVKAYDYDYWGIGFYEGLRHILKNDSSDTLDVYFYSPPLVFNSFILPEKERNRLNFITEPTPRSYYLTNFRYDPDDQRGKDLFNDIVHEIYRQGSPLVRIWRRKP